MRFFWSLLPLAVLAALASAAPVDSVVARGCPNGKPGCGEGPTKRDVVVAVRCFSSIVFHPRSFSRARLLQYSSSS
ncbi:hypothetical protein C8Q76DRAFT_712501, partial [Earliella scabrosa]